MSTERPTKQITTKNGKHTAILREWITVQESRTISAIYTSGLDSSTIDVNAEKANFKGNIAELSQEAQNKAIEIVIVELDGDKENILERFLNLPNQDGQEIIAAIEEVTAPEEKK